jgi:hypothetical protein
MVGAKLWQERSRGLSACTDVGTPAKAKNVIGVLARADGRHRRTSSWRRPNTSRTCRRAWRGHGLERVVGRENLLRVYGHIDLIDLSETDAL